MSAAVRPTSAVLRRARHVPMTQCLARRWQTNTAQSQSYEEMLSGLEAEFPDPSKAPSKSKHMNERPKSPRKREQPTENTHASPDAASLPAVKSFETGTRTNVGEKSQSIRISHLKKTLRHNDENVQAAIPRQSTTHNKYAQRPRGIPPPTFKPSSEPPTKQDVPEKPMIRKMWYAYAKPEESQAPEAIVSPAVQPPPSTSPEPPSSDQPPPKNIQVAEEDTESPLPHDMNPLETTIITLSDRQKKPYDNIFLRDSCACDRCVNTSTRQKKFDSADIPANIRVRSLDYEGDDVVISWKHDVSGYDVDHRTRLSQRWLDRTVNQPVTTAYTDGKCAWNTALFESKRVDFDYNEYMSDEKVLFELLRQLHVFGLAFIKNVPEAESSVIETANRIGPLKNTFYGDTWDVRSVSNAKNVAYTDVHLGFHMDLLYMQQPPRLQLLHCLRASTQGGVSLFSDSYQAAEQLNQLDHNAFRVLVETPVNFHYDNDNHHYFRSRRTFQLRDDCSKHSEDFRDQRRVWDSLEAVNWAPPFQAPFSDSGDHYKFAKKVRAWHEAAQLFRDLTEMQSAVYKRQMAPGECVIFDNRRVLHARTAFAGGERWLRGTYLDDDPYLSKIRVLERTYGNINGNYMS